MPYLDLQYVFSYLEQFLPFCGLLLTFANRLDPDQDQQNVGPDLDPKPFDTDSVHEFFFVEKAQVSRQQQKHEKLPSMQRVMLHFFVRSASWYVL